MLKWGVDNNGNGYYNQPGAGLSRNNRVVRLAAVIAIGVCETGERRVLGLATGASESEAVWSEFLRSLVGRGLKGV